jgi:uncharacterized membrane protein YoaK (UPF0700 family)
MMLRHAKLWLVAAVLFGLGNVAGAVMAAMALEPLHTATHVVLALISASVARALVSTPQSVDVASIGAPIEIVSSRLTQLELSLEGLATGVDRMRDGQRAITRLFAERSARARNAAEGERRDAP